MCSVFVERYDNLTLDHSTPRCFVPCMCNSMKSFILRNIYMRERERERERGREGGREGKEREADYDQYSTEGKTCIPTHIDRRKHDDFGSGWRRFQGNRDPHGEFKGRKLQKEPTHHRKGRTDLDPLVRNRLRNEVWRCWEKPSQSTTHRNDIIMM